MIYLIIALVIVILLLVLGAWLSGREDGAKNIKLKVSQEAMNRVRESNISYNDTEKLSKEEVIRKINAKMVRKK